MSGLSMTPAFFIVSRKSAANFVEGEKVTLFVSKNNDLVTIISLTYCKRFRLDMLYGGTKM